MFKIDLISKG